jgi:hypothetical protein
MPQGGRPKRAKEPCQVCDGPIYEIWHRDGHGGEELLETHCNQCGAAWDSEGQPRYRPSNRKLLDQLGLGEVSIMPLYTRR